MRWWPAALMLAVVLGSMSQTAAGQDDDSEARARQHFDRGVALHDAGEREEALVEYRAAYTIQPRALILLNAGIALVELGRDAEAANALAAYLAADDADVRRRPKVEAILADLDSKLGQLILPPDVAGSWFIDGASRDPLAPGNVVRVNPGSHQVAVQMTGHALRSLGTFEVAAGARVQVPFTPPPVASSEPAPPSEPAPITPASPARVETAISTAQTAPARRQPWGTIFARADIDAHGRGGVFAPGIAVRLGPVELFGSGLIGARIGAEAGVRFELTRWRVRPTLSAAVPVFFEDGARPGGRAAIGVVLHLSHSWRLSLDAGGTHTPSPPEGFLRTIPLGSVGLAVLL